MNCPRDARSATSNPAEQAFARSGPPKDDHSALHCGSQPQSLQARLPSLVLSRHATGDLPLRATANP